MRSWLIYEFTTYKRPIPNFELKGGGLIIHSLRYYIVVTGGSESVG